MGATLSVQRESVEPLMGAMYDIFGRNVFSYDSVHGLFVLKFIPH